jgi:UTP--glucose-1-phosphate uridylyltransferase
MLVTSVKKAVIPAAGLGTRFLPVTKSMPKEMLPIIDKPVIHYVVEEAIASGIEDIIIITGRGKRAIEDYFDASPELEMHLINHKKEDLLGIVRDISSLVDIHYVRQKEPLGLGDAVLRAEKHISNEPFAVLLGDDIIVNDIPCTEQLIKVFEKYKYSVMAVEQIPTERIPNYGIIDCKKVDTDLYLLNDIIEKPDIKNAPSNIGTVGRYIFTPEIFDCLRSTSPGVGNEIQLTDAIRILKGYQRFYAYHFHGRRYDTGDKAGYVKAIIDFAMEYECTRKDVLEHIRDIKL